MSIFDGIPESFPHKAKFKKTPISFEMRSDPSDYYADMLIHIGIFAVVVAVVFFAANPFSPWVAGFDTWTKVLGIVAVIVAAFYAGKKVFEAYSWLDHSFQITITDTTVEVVETGSKGKPAWSRPISEYVGIALENHGTHEIHGDKKPIIALVMRHAEEAYSIPLIITDDINISEKAIARATDKLRLPFVTHERSTVLNSDVPEGSIVANLFQSLKVRFIYWFLQIAGVALIAAGIYIFLNFGLASGMGGVLRPFMERLAFGGAMAVMGVLCILGIRYYMSQYVVQMQREGDQITIKTAAQIGDTRHRFAASEVESIDFRSGKIDLNHDDEDEYMYEDEEGNYTPTVNAPWLKMKISSIKRPFIIDMQADYINLAELKKLIS